MPVLKVYDEDLAAFVEVGGSTDLVEAEVIVEEATTEVTISDLDGNAAGGYTFTYEGVSEAANSLIYITFNGDNTNSNYYARYISFWGSTVETTLGAALNFIGYISSGAGSSPICYSHGSIGMSRSRIVATVDILYTSPTDPSGFRSNIIHNATSANITSIKITAATSNGLGVGTKFTLYRRK